MASSCGSTARTSAGARCSATPAIVELAVREISNADLIIADTPYGSGGQREASC